MVADEILHIINKAENCTHSFLEYRSFVNDIEFISDELYLDKCQKSKMENLWVEMETINAIILDIIEQRGNKSGFDVWIEEYKVAAQGLIKRFITLIEKIELDWRNSFLNDSWNWKQLRKGKILIGEYKGWNIKIEFLSDGYYITLTNPSNSASWDDWLETEDELRHWLCRYRIKWDDEM